MAMKSPLGDFGGKLQSVWGGMNQGQKMLFILLTTVLVAGIATVFMYSGKTDYAPVFSSSDPAESGKVVDSLKELGIPYRLSGGGLGWKFPRIGYTKPECNWRRKAFLPGVRVLSSWIKILLV